jgi:hypothetical protein
LRENKDGFAHRFRDTFSVSRLLAGVPIDQVSILLGHSNIKVTQEHYNPWVRDRQPPLEAGLQCNVLGIGIQSYCLIRTKILKGRNLILPN